MKIPILLPKVFNYPFTYKYNPKIRSKYIVKVRQVTNSILDEANKAKDNGDILFALSSLKRLIELRPELEQDFTFGIESLENKIDSEKDKQPKIFIIFLSLLNISEAFVKSLVPFSFLMTDIFFLIFTISKELKFETTAFKIFTL